MAQACNPGCGRWKQVSQEFKVILVYIKPCLRTKQNETPAVTTPEEESQGQSELYGMRLCFSLCYVTNSRSLGHGPSCLHFTGKEIEGQRELITCAKSFGLSGSLTIYSRPILHKPLLSLQQE